MYCHDHWLLFECRTLIVGVVVVVLVVVAVVVFSHILDVVFSLIEAVLSFTSKYSMSTPFFIFSIYIYIYMCIYIICIYSVSFS